MLSSRCSHSLYQRPILVPSVSKLWGFARPGGSSLPFLTGNGRILVPNSRLSNSVSIFCSWLRLGLVWLLGKYMERK
uniref:Uncharacterized protein n=1 Tax=Rhizophora mucronata TaxID=61149 RepID=A0A2P2KDX0_RHIMU